MAKRCSWCGNDPVYQDYHDSVWGRPVFDSNELFAKLCLDGQQAGLSWITILKKQAHYEKVFYQFDPEKIVANVPSNFEQLMADKGIVRNKLKIQSIVTNAECFLAMRTRGINFNEFLWSFVDGQPIQNSFTAQNEIPTSTAASDAMAKALKKEGFKFVGTTICYAFMQAVGMVNDHITDCLAYDICKGLGQKNEIPGYV
tara:strand:+ start:388 stop:987 length:600 start_codon:yes stop_codon:yes gene_type:complete